MINRFLCCSKDFIACRSLPFFRFQEFLHLLSNVERNRINLDSMRRRRRRRRRQTTLLGRLRRRCDDPMVFGDTSPNHAMWSLHISQTLSPTSGALKLSSADVMMTTLRINVSHFSYS